MQLSDLTGKTALITGTSRGLGLAFAEGLAQAGAGAADRVHAASGPAVG